MNAGEAKQWLARDWVRWLILLWVAAAALMIWSRWGPIRGFALGDTDDNLRIMQMRAWLAGQDWFDLRQYRLAPPLGADIHWSRIPDLPIAGIKLLLTPLVGGPDAERAAVALAPLLPMAVAFGSLAVIARRMIAPATWPLAIALLLCAHSARGMFAPLRIDHHGWQLATLALVMAALTDPKRARGGLLLGCATALSLAIGLEMLVYLAAAGATVGLLWIWERGEARRLAAYGATLAGGTALGFLIFASRANSAPVCDALSPVWLSVTVGAGALLVLLSLLRTEARAIRLAAAAAGGAVLAIAFASLWPECLGRPEGVSPELDRLWLSNVREARPLYRHPWTTMAAIGSLPLAGLAGYALMLWRLRGDGPALARWAALALPALLAALLLLWQTRAGPAAQLLAVPGAAALLAAAFDRFGRMRNPVAGASAILISFALVSGLAVQSLANELAEPPNRRAKTTHFANSVCPTLAALRPIALQPAGDVLTFVDLGPRLIAVTPHRAIAGPYHRNGDAIIDVMHAFRGNAATAREIIDRRGINYVLICPNMSESTIYAKAAPRGFYAMLAKGKAPAWLEPVALPRNNPYRMWRVSPETRR